MDKRDPTMSEQDPGKNTPGQFDPERVDDLLTTGGGMIAELGEDGGLSLGEEQRESWIGRHVGAYRVTEFLDRGGMSLVFKAERCDGEYEQLVAIKVLQAAIFGELAERFVQERKLLAKLEHPGIARILDSGVSQSQPWIAMELIDGAPIDDYCDTHKLAIDDRLELFTQVARAVQYAHGQLIVHRDIKPGNILVNERAEIKLLDFGIGRIIHDGKNTEPTESTLVVTPQYASPEQVRGEPVGTGSDIYQLGLLLYKLLTGLDAQQIRDSNIRNIVSAVLDDHPERPSSRLQTTAKFDAEMIEQIAHDRSTSVGRLQQQLHGDIDIIVEECLHKNPDDRYLSAQSLINDVSNCRQMLPIMARPPSAWYRTDRFIQRHRGGVLASLLIFVLLVGSLVATSLSWRRTLIAEQAAIEQAETADTVATFLSDMLSEADPRDTDGADPAISEILDRSQERLDALSSRPLVQGKLALTMAEAYMAIRQLDKAKVLVTTAINAYSGGAHSEALVDALNVQSEVFQIEGDFDQAVATARQAMEVAKNANSSSLNLANAQGSLAAALSDRGRYDEASEMIRAAIAGMPAGLSSEVDLNRATAYTTLGTINRQQGNHADAAEAFENGLEITMAATPGQEGMLAQQGLINYHFGVLEMQREDFTTAETKLTTGLETLRQVYGDSHEALLGPQLFLARTQLENGDLQEAQLNFDRSLQLVRTFLGEEHPNYAMVLLYTTNLDEQLGELARAQQTLQTATELITETLGPDHPYQLRFRLRRAELTLAQGRHEEALAILEPLRVDSVVTYGEEHPSIANIDNLLLEAGQASP